MAVIEEDGPHKLGGTCVNVGCVPKKLMVYGSHYAAELEIYAKSLPVTYGHETIQFLYAQPASSLVEGITAPKIPGAKSTSFDQWPKSLQGIAARLGELIEEDGR